MSHAPTKARLLAVEIHRAPAGMSKEEFHAKMKALAAAVVALPAVQKNVIKYQIVRLDCRFPEPDTEISTGPRYSRPACSTSTSRHLGCRLRRRSILLYSWPSPRYDRVPFVSDANKSTYNYYRHQSRCSKYVPELRRSNSFKFRRRSPGTQSFSHSSRPPKK
jgi:hypothetical protein